MPKNLLKGGAGVGVRGQHRGNSSRGATPFRFVPPGGEGGGKKNSR